MDGEYQLGFEVYADTANLTVSYELEANGGQKTFLAKELNSWQTISQTFKVRNVSSVPTFRVTALGGVGGTGYIRNVSIKKLGVFAKELLKTGIDISNRKIVLTADKTLVRSNSGVEIAMFKEVNGVPMIDAKNLYTENLEVRAGATIGGFSVKGNDLINENFNAKIGIYDSSRLRFVTIGGTNSPIINISSYGSNTTGMYILSNNPADDGTNYAIKSYGQHVFGQRSGDVWNGPGILRAARINGGGGMECQWGNGTPAFSSYKRSAGVYVITHNLGRTDYIPLVSMVSDWNFINVQEIYDNYFVVYVRARSGTLEDDTFSVIIVGRNAF